MRRIILSVLAALLFVEAAEAEGRKETTLSDGWQFYSVLSGENHPAVPKWTEVSVPHDWAISGPFDKKWDLQRVASVQNGEKEASEKTGRSGALPWIGEGFYRRTLTISDGCEHAELLFDGAMAEPIVSINGKQAGFWAYGYNTFRVDITPYVHAGNNLLEVHLRNMEESSRWYPGAGIFRPVTLIETSRTHLDDWSLYARVVGEKDKVRTLEITGKVLEPDERTAVRLTLTSPAGENVGDLKPLQLASGGSFHTTINVPDAQLWSPETPNLYKLTANVVDANGKVLDTKSIKTGIRTVRVSREHGLQLNGQSRKIKGVCLHHDLGPLGAAINKAALIRQIKIMKQMGCDAIRTSHNMPSQMQMEICDSLGMMVMAESFDMWLYPKCKNGYARFFREWADRDIANLVLAHRNHPSIVMWSIGNEIPEQWSEEGRQIAIRLQGICHALDPSRPVTQGCDRVDNALASGFIRAMDVPGFNYRLHRYADGIKQLPQGFLLGSETASTVSSRGVYKFPVTPAAADSPEGRPFHKDGQCSGYDIEWCSWSNLPDDDWRWQDDEPWVIGEFVWTGFDYLGEPTPYDGYWPSRSSYFGICDLAGLPKDRYFLYRSHWNTQDHTIHLLPHWTWGRERRGEVTPVYCYTDYPSAELFVNGKSQGRISKQRDSRLDRYRLRWNEVKYEPGELRVVVYDDKGAKAGEQTIRTAGIPSRLKLDVWTQRDKPELLADGDDLAFITVSLTDSRGTLIPDAADKLTFEVTGAGSFKAACNGDATSTETFTQPTMHLFAGQLVVVVRSAREAGMLKLRVRDAQRKLSETVTLAVR
ncbi:MAG: DUF4982 domain-containing protein [Bacteroidaceae bacterium]|nr:DUF4982 domain-containing protein [Bacteroidaceae bacterium]